MVEKHWRKTQKEEVYVGGSVEGDWVSQKALATPHH